MSMTISSLKAFMAKSKGKVLAIYFDNDDFWYFDKPDDQISDDMFETVGGVEFVKTRSFLSSQRCRVPKTDPATGETKYEIKPGISKLDIPVWIYKPVDDIQGVMFLENIADLEYIDKGALKILG